MQCNVLPLAVIHCSLQEDQNSENVPPDSLLNFIHWILAKDYTAKNTNNALGLSGRFLAKNHSMPVTLLSK
jgi:hypothetical protein